jgi:alpha-tubulin suppressor-like RCC1 family protein
VPKIVPNVVGVESLAAGGSHECAIDKAGRVQCWGTNVDGELGDGTFGAQPGPVPVVNLGPAVGIAAGLEGSCAIQISGNVSCWGDNEFGQLGNGMKASTSSPAVSTPVTVVGLTNVLQIATGLYNTCAVRSDGTLACWGINDLGELGNGTTAASNVPISVPGLSGVTQVVVSDSGLTCALLQYGTVKCWGDDDYGALGDGQTGLLAFRATPVDAPVLGVTMLAAGMYHVCALLSDAEVACWGSNAFGQLGVQGGQQCYDGSACSLQPVFVPGLGDVTAITAGGYHTCVLVAGGEMECWGLNVAGELGNGVFGHAPGPPAFVLAANGVYSF